MDKILLDATRSSVVEETNRSNIKFQNIEERQNYINQRIDLQIKAVGLDQPWYSPNRFTNTVLKVMVLDLGESNYLTSESGSANVRDIILEKVPKTILLFTTSTLIITIIGLYLGAFVANRAHSVWDKTNSAFAVFSSSFPTWWIGMLMIFVFAFTYHIFPARATPLTSLYSHALKNAAPPIITVVALSLASSFGGAIIVEATFGWDGIGSLYYQAIGFLDIPVIVGLTYISTLIFVFTIFVTDVVYAYFDPRVKIS
jgi:peptide/nickel transport system permease protein